MDPGLIRRPNAARALQPWTSDGTSGTARAPSAGIRVVNGAYQTFARNPQTAVGGGWEPRAGTYLIRETTMSTCDFRPEGQSTGCLGGIVRVFEVLARLSP